MRTIITKLDFNNTVKLLEEKYEHLETGGSFFIFFSTQYSSTGNVEHDFLEIISVADSLGYDYINTIVFPTENVQNVSFVDNVRYIIWLCKKRSLLVFDKDYIREKHIWKDVEWGRRAKNYNPKGKDPGNVWIPTLDDGKANITDHILLNENEVLNKLLNMTQCGDDYELHEEEIETVSKTEYTALGFSSFENKTAKVVFGTSEELLNVDEGKATTVVTSPPYWDLKDYFKEGQIGQESYDEYLCRMKKVWKECYRILEDNGSLWININVRVKAGKVILIPNDIVRTCKELGFFYKGILIWHKSSGIPTGDKNIVDRHEYVLLFTKSETFTVKKHVFEEYSDYKNDRINGGAFWNINRKAGSVGKKHIHPAIYPNGLVERIVSISSNNDSLVFDPFLGSGTSLIAAAKMGRSFVGYEYNEGFKELMESRFNAEIPEVAIHFVYQK